MIYIVVALKCEAQAFVDRFRLPKTKQNNDISVVVSGVGRSKMFQTTKEIVKNMTQNDKIVNIGICGAEKKFPIGSVIDGFKQNITCVEKEVSTSMGYEVVDMESSGFIDATHKIKNRYIFKVVSDHFEPHTITKEKTKQLIFNVIDEIMQRVTK